MYLHVGHVETTWKVDADEVFGEPGLEPKLPVKRTYFPWQR